ncbi:hypothetical protein BGP_4471 [Beggiatoa sp. PS]|nr:hypothetical protein BGP_4471 [Beggiatoa sp. PS]
MMILNATINSDGTLNTIIPKFLWGKPVTISITPQTESHSSWESISEIFQEADALDFPRKTHQEILSELRTFRETQ